MRVTAMGAKYKRTDVEVARQIGEGSFGVVYQGKIDARRAGDVVLKRPKLTVEGAAELQEVEAWMNDRVTRDARGSCADFLGSFRVTPDESYLNQSEGVIAKEGLWLVWKFEGDRTLAQYMAQPDYPTGIARHLLPDKDGDKSLRGDPAVELEVTQAAMKQLFTNLKNVHKAGLVHRDIKPHNLVLTGTDDEARFKLIDLGACACFRTGMNFAPDGSTPATACVKRSWPSAWASPGPLCAKRSASWRPMAWLLISRAKGRVSAHSTMPR